MISLTFSSGPWGPKCLKYQNVPNLGSFWAIGKPWERFQSWDIRIYFIPVPKDHTVAHGELIKKRLSALLIRTTYNFITIKTNIMKHPRLYFVFVFSHSIQCFWMLVAKDILECVELGFLRMIRFVISNISFYSCKEWSEKILASESGYHDILLFFPPNVSNLLLHLSAF